MPLHPSVAQHIPKIRELAAEYGVDRLEIFGSAMTDRFDLDRSDVDFLVHYPEGYSFGYFGKNLVDLEAKIAEVVGRPVELIMTSAVSKDSFRHNADKTRMSIYESSGQEASPSQPAGAESNSQ